MKPAVMRAALAAGASMINDVRALQARGALEAVAASGAAVCLMHMQGEPRDDAAVDRTTTTWWARCAISWSARALACEAAGIARDRIAIDPGFGFGKTVAHNLALLRATARRSRRSGYPVLAGLSRKCDAGRDHRPRR